jgi:hypothetical protein
MDLNHARLPIPPLRHGEIRRDAWPSETNIASGGRAKRAVFRFYRISFYAASAFALLDGLQLLVLQRHPPVSNRPAQTGAR